jgi:succinate dehydrogenase hydrophobic anchor subunit
MARRRHRRSWWGRHSLTIVALVLLVLWIAGYVWLDPQSHLGAFCGNAIADWSGSLVIILGTKFLYEIGSAESKKVRGRLDNPLLEFLREHSLLLFIIVTGIGWAILFLRMNPESRWGAVVGNVASEWVQMGGLVFLTKRLVEIGSKE